MDCRIIFLGIAIVFSACTPADFKNLAGSDIISSSGSGPGGGPLDQPEDQELSEDELIALIQMQRLDFETAIDEELVTASLTGLSYNGQRASVLFNSFAAVGVEGLLAGFRNLYQGAPVSYSSPAFVNDQGAMVGAVSEDTGANLRAMAGYLAPGSNEWVTLSETLELMPGFSLRFSRARKISNAGQILGSLHVREGGSQPISRFVVWPNAGADPVGIPGIAYDMAANGMVVGQYCDEDLEDVACPNGGTGGGGERKFFYLYDTVLGEFTGVPYDMSPEYGYLEVRSVGPNGDFMGELRLLEDGALTAKRDLFIFDGEFKVYDIAEAFDVERQNPHQMNDRGMIVGELY